MFGTYINDTVKMFKPVLFENTRVHVIWIDRFQHSSAMSQVSLTFKMPVIERNANIIQSQAFEKLGVGIREEIFKELNNICEMR